jgi:hypothetical protein
MKKGQLYFFLLGVLIQLYYLFSWIYPFNLDLTYEMKQLKHMEFWPFFSNTYHPVLFVFIVTISLVSMMVYILATSNSTFYKRTFLIAECILTVLIGFSLL